MHIHTYALARTQSPPLRPVIFSFCRYQLPPHPLPTPYPLVSSLILLSRIAARVAQTQLLLLRRRLLGLLLGLGVGVGVGGEALGDEVADLLGVLVEHAAEAGLGAAADAAEALFADLLGQPLVGPAGVVRRHEHEGVALVPAGQVRVGLRLDRPQVAGDEVDDARDAVLAVCWWEEREKREGSV